MATHKFDISIIGSGPAGCAAALALSGSGLKIALIDKHHFPRDKVCGDAIPGPAIKALTKAFPFMHQSLFDLKDKQRIRNSRIILGNGRTISYQWQLPAYNIKRKVFDAFLLEQVKQHSDTKIISGFDLHKIEKGESFTLFSKDGKNSIKSKFLIACDGVGSTTASCLGHEVMPVPEKVMAIRAYYKGINLASNTNHFFVLKKYLPGYFWVFPLGEDMFNVGFGIKTGRDGKVKCSMKKVIDDIIQTENLSAEFKNATQASESASALIPIGGKKSSISGDGFLLAGDAAHLADPLQGHGIDKAIVSGMLAGVHAKRCFEQNNYSADFNLNYDKIIREGIGKELRKNRRQQQILGRAPWLLNIYAMLKK